jgi:hypothetical protein
MTQIMILAGCVYLSMLAAAVYFTKASPRRVVGALAGGGAVAVVGAGVEEFAHARGCWHYTSRDTPIGPVAMYPVKVYTPTARPPGGSRSVMSSTLARACPPFAHLMNQKSAGR